MPLGLIGRMGTRVPVWEPSCCAHPGSSSVRAQHQCPAPRAADGGQLASGGNAHSGDVSGGVSGKKGLVWGAQGRLRSLSPSRDGSH